MLEKFFVDLGGGYVWTFTHAKLQISAVSVSKLFLVTLHTHTLTRIDDELQFD